jgi:hypothetical protein
METTLTKEDIKREIIRCGKDPVYFITNFARISHPIQGTIQFNLYPFQQQMVKDFVSHRFVVVNKGRQLGLSTTSAAYVAWLMLFYREKSILVVATKLGTAANLVRKVKSIIKNLPPWLAVTKIKFDNKNSFELENGSWVKASSTSGDAGRSEALSLLVVDEAAHIDNMNEMWAAMYPTLSTGGRCIAISTPFGVGNWFHKTYTDAESGKNDFYPVKLHWSVHPERDQAWFDKETKNMPDRQIAQELECSFNASGDTVVSGRDLERLFGLTKEPKYKTGFDRNFWIWESFDPSKKYMLVADVARGDGADYSTFHIFEVESMEQVAEYQGKLPLDEFSRLIHDCGREYGSCLAVVENNSFGVGVANKLKELGYPNVFYSNKNFEYIDQMTAEGLSINSPGVYVSSKTRPLIIAKFEEFIRNNYLKINSVRLINELTTFIWNHGRAEAQRTYNDDLVMPCAIACWVRDTAIQSSIKDLQYRNAMVNAISVGSSFINTKIPGMQGYRQPKSDLLSKYAEYQQHSWIIRG